MKQHILLILAIASLTVTMGCKTVSLSSNANGARFTSAEQPIDNSQPTVKPNLFKPITVTASAPGRESKKVVVSFNSPSYVNIDLNRLFNITSVPSEAEVYLDGEYLGTTPLQEASIDDSGAMTIELRKKGWLPAKMTVTQKTPVDISITMDQDGSGRKILDLIPTADGVEVISTPIYSDTDIGEHSPNVSSCKKLTNQSQTEFILSFSLLPDGKTLVTSILEELNSDKRTEYRANIWQLNTSIAGAPRKAVTQGDYFDIEPNPSADGEALYFATTRNGRLGIWNLKLNGKGGLRTVTAGNTADFAPALKPRTEHLFYSAVLPGSSAPAYIWNKEQGMPEQLTEGTSPIWSPDGSKLLYIKGDVKQNKARIWMCDADGGNQTMISSGSGEFNDVDASWSLDGKKIIFASNRSILKDKHNYDIYIMDAEGGNVVQLTTNGSHDDKPVFAPDGKTVFFRSNRGLVWDIWTMEISVEQ